MKKVTFLLGIGLSLLTLQFAQGQTTVMYHQAAEVNAPAKTDTLQTQVKTDIVINMDMIESFRRCYDKIETIDWASLLRDVSADEVGMVYMAYCRMNKNTETNIDSNTLIAEKDKIKKELETGAPIRLNLSEELSNRPTANLVNQN